MKRIVLSVLAAALLGPATAAAQLVQVPPFDVERLSLDPSAVSSMVVGTAEVRPLAQPRFFLAGHYENRPLVLRTDDSLRGNGVWMQGTRDADTIHHKVSGHFGVAVAATERFELDMRVPVVIWQNGGSGFSAPTAKAGIGSVSAGFRYVALKQGTDAPFSAALALEAFTPFGREKALAGNDTWAFNPRVELGHKYSKLVVGAELGALLRDRPVEFGAKGQLGSEVRAGMVVATTGAPLRGELSVRGSLLDGVDQSMEILAGARYSFGCLEAFALGGPGFFQTPGTPQFRGVLGIAFVPPAPKPPPPPPKPVDPCAAGQAHTPAQCPDLDDDKDGILNKDDACPAVPGIVEEKGCPAKDTDLDGVPDHKDKCPTVQGIAELQGCPAVDTDGDGVPDHKDKCPAVAGVADNAGCPPAKAKLNVVTKKIDILEKVYFDTGKATIQPRSYPVLDEVAQILKENAQISKVLVEGHTDNTGAADFNTVLSGNRAKAVKEYLVGKGIDGARLDSKGFGPSRPVADNKTKEGRELNRRVEFTIP